MGRAPGRRRNVSDRPDFLALQAQAHADQVDAAPDQCLRSMFEFYGLAHYPDMLDLAERLESYACRDQDNPDDANLATIPMTERRATGHRLAGEIRDHAREMIRNLEAIHRKIGRFEETTRMLPALLEEIFDVDTGPPNNLFLPKPIAPLEDFFGRRSWDEVDADLVRLIDMPVRPKVNRGPVPRLVLRHALVACRRYWSGVEGRSWSMSSLKQGATRKQADRMLLQGECEAFVCDMLALTGVGADLPAVATAWTWTDARPEAVPVEMLEVQAQELSQAARDILHKSNKLSPRDLSR